MRGESATEGTLTNQHLDDLLPSSETVDENVGGFEFMRSSVLLDLRDRRGMGRNVIVRNGNSSDRDEVLEVRLVTRCSRVHKSKNGRPNTPVPISYSLIAVTPAYSPNSGFSTWLNLVSSRRR